MSYRNRNNRIYIGRVSRKTSLKDLEYIFGKYGRILDIDIKHDYAFIEYDSSRDAQYSIKQMDGRILDGSRLRVELAGKHNRNDNRTRKGPGPEDVCYSCKKKGHWANECKDADTDRCFRCNERGHIKRNCTLSRTPSPKRGRSRSPRSPRKSPGEKGGSASNSRKESPASHRESSRSPFKESPKPTKNEPSPQRENQNNETHSTTPEPITQQVPE